MSSNLTKLILGSQSPRRQELLQQAGFTFAVKTKSIDESYPAHLAAREIAMYIARAKSEAIYPEIDSESLLITADTIVWNKQVVLGKPANGHEAYEMLQQLSNDQHQVTTGVVLKGLGVERTFSVTTEVSMKMLSGQEIDYYIRHYAPFDKAGAYGIQEWIGLIGIRYIYGCYFNVVGLPMSRLWEELTEVTPQLLPIANYS